MSDEAPADAPRITGGSPTEEETAAIAAVFAELIAERAASIQRIEPSAVPSAWLRGARPIRERRAAVRTWGAQQG